MLNQDSGTNSHELLRPHWRLKFRAPYSLFVYFVYFVVDQVLIRGAVPVDDEGCSVGAADVHVPRVSKVDAPCREQSEAG